MGRNYTREIGNESASKMLIWKGQWWQEVTPKVAIIVLNWNGWRDTIECLESILRNDYFNYQIIVVDNNSSNNSMEYIKEWAEGRQEVLTSKVTHPLYYLSYPPVKKPIPYVYYTHEGAEEGGNVELENRLMNKLISEKSRTKLSVHSPIYLSTNYPLVFIQTGGNLGFASGNNVGIRYALSHNADFVYVFNNDIVAPKDFILKTVNFFEEQAEDVALIGPKIIDGIDLSDWQYPVKKRFSLGGWFYLFSGVRKFFKNRFLDNRYLYSGGEVTEVYAVLGSCMCFRAKMLNEIDMFDERTFLFWEEFIIAERFYSKKYKIIYNPRITIFHKWHQSFKNIKAKSYLYNFESELIFFSRYRRFDSLSLIIIKFIRIIRFILGLLLYRDFRNLKVINRFIRILLFSVDK